LTIHFSGPALPASLSRLTAPLATLLVLLPLAAGGWAGPKPASAPAPAGQKGLITIESDTQSADNITGVVTALGNVRIVYPSRGMVATSRQAQYFSKEGRLVLSGDVDVVQEGGNTLKAERVVYLLDDERALAEPSKGGQVFSQMVIRQQQTPPPTPLTP